MTELLYAKVGFTPIDAVDYVMFNGEKSTDNWVEVDVTGGWGWRFIMKGQHQGETERVEGVFKLIQREPDGTL